MIRNVEWPTLALFIAAYAAWALAVIWLSQVGLIPAVVLTGVAMALQSSLQHEAIHGHPFRRTGLNTALAGVPLTLFVPYLRFTETHLAHHRDSRLTDPFDDPESNFLDGGEWERLPRVVRAVLSVNNTLAGRLLVGPLVGTAVFLRSDWRRRREPRVVRDWSWHLAGVVPVVALVLWSPMPVWGYLAACYLALSLLRIRTFLEHQAHELCRSRSVIIEDRGPLAFLFLNNNLHVVHHMHPGVPWYRLPRLFRQNRSRYLEINGGYAYRSYGEVFRRYFLKAKDPVAHPLWRRRKERT